MATYDLGTVPKIHNDIPQSSQFGIHPGGDGLALKNFLMATETDAMPPAVPEPEAEAAAAAPSKETSEAASAPKDAGAGAAETAASAGEAASAPAKTEASKDPLLAGAPRFESLPPEMKKAGP